MLRFGLRVVHANIPPIGEAGATTYYIEISRRASGDAACVPPAFSLYAVPGALDLLIASEPLEAARQVAAGFATPDRTRVIVSSERTLTTFEKMQPADGRADTASVFALLRDYSRGLDVIAMSTIAQRERTALSAVMFGALAGSAELPFPREAFEHTIRDFGRGVETSLAGFSRAHSALAEHAFAKSAESNPPDCAIVAAEDVRSMLALGHSRLVDYQDGPYASLYETRVAKILAAEQASDPAAVHGQVATRVS